MSTKSTADKPIKEKAESKVKPAAKPKAKTKPNTEKPTKSKTKKSESVESDHSNDESDKPEIKVRVAKQISQLEHAKRKSMWVGSKKIQTNNMFVLDSQYKFVLKDIKFTPAWYKIVDEVFVNALDQWVSYPKLVTEIRITFNPVAGSISVYNNGPSIGVYEVENLNGVRMYAPQMIASEFLSGDNLDDNEDRTTGGTNGAGLKLVNAFSDWLTIETVDPKAKKHYTQMFKDRLLVIEKPVIRKTTSDEKMGFTKITFLPSYHAFGYEKYTTDISTDLSKLIESRAYQAAAFTKATVYYNDSEIEIEPIETAGKIHSTFYNFSHMFLPTPQHGLWQTKLVSTDPLLKKYPWELCIGVSDGKFRQVSLINGIWVYGGGSHIKHLQNSLVDNLKTKVEKLLKKSKTKFNVNYILNNLFVFVRCSIPNPEFTSQVKDTLNDPIEKFTTYKFKEKDFGTLWIMFEPHIMSLFLDKYKDKLKTRVTRGAINVPKCIDAKYAGNKTKWMKCRLIICEGDSAMGTIHEGIVNKNTKLSYDYYGTFSIQGVPMNARKEVSEFLNKNGDKTLIRNMKLQKNERISSLIKVIGLDYEKTYALTPDGDAEFQTLRYPQIICAVDEDTDGKGFIFGLIINLFVLFWPNLAKRGFITRFTTPIIRAYPKNKSKFVEEFGSMKQYKQWINEKYDGDDDKLLRDYTLKYFKGLGSHKKQEIPHMFKDFEKRLCTYHLDKDAIKNLDAYLGVSTAQRKVALATPVTRDESDGQNIPISEQLERDLKEYQRDNIMRKLPHLCDGSVPSRRKVLYTARKVFSVSNHEMKVNAFVNETSKTTHYHHGEASLAGTVTKMAQDFPGARNLPFLRPQGQFGTRSNGGKDAADPRYTFTNLNTRLCFDMFPKDDDFLLKYTFDDGVRCEPEFYVPIIPISVMESMEIPATGWKIKMWARDWKDVIKNVRGLIDNKLKKSKSMGVWLKDNIGTVRKSDGKEYSVGKYIYDKAKNTITITELPLGKFSGSFLGDYSSGDLKHLCCKPQFKGKPQDKTNDDGVCIVFQLTDDAWEYISTNYGNADFDCVEDFMNLRTSLDTNINMIGVDGAVREFDKYERVVDEWFPVRKQLYADRIDRHVIITNLLVSYLENIIKFTKNHQSYNITPKTSLDEVDKILTKNKYDKFNATLLLSPKYTKVSELSSLIINGVNCSYEYLIKLSYRDMVECACKKREQQLLDAKQKLKDLESDSGTDTKFKGYNTWIKELDQLESTIADGLKLGWSYGKDVVKFR
jgi:DNA topoisomerase-2